MSQVPLEAFLARLYTDATLREAFLADPASATCDDGLSQADADALRSIDSEGLRMAAASYAHKREQHRKPKRNLRESLLSWWKR